MEECCYWGFRWKYTFYFKSKSPRWTTRNLLGLKRPDTCLRDSFEDENSPVSRTRSDARVIKRRKINFDEIDDTSLPVTSFRTPTSWKGSSSNFKGNRGKRLLVGRESTKIQKTFRSIQKYCNEEAGSNSSRSSRYQTDLKKMKIQFHMSPEEQLIGDFTRPYALPLVSGEHPDLKSITSETLSKLIMGEYNDSIASFMIIDCRYPYEFDGGHIRGAVNIHSREQIMNELLKNRAPEEHLSARRNILVFHCEFSYKRSPSLLRYLRKQDQWIHDYPMLAYPEVYLLHGGYEAFFQRHKDLCEPQNYVAMLDPRHITDYLRY